MTRAISTILMLLLAGNGVVMLMAGRWWYGVVPGVTETGPFNPHFVKDIGAAYLVSGLALAWRIMRPSVLALGAAMAGAGFLVLHALIHVAEAAIHPTGLSDLVRDFSGVILPAIFAAWIAWPTRSRLERSHAQSPAAPRDHR